MVATFAAALFLTACAERIASEDVIKDAAMATHLAYQNCLESHHAPVPPERDWRAKLKDSEWIAINDHNYSDEIWVVILDKQDGHPIQNCGVNIVDTFAAPQN